MWFFFRKLDWALMGVMSLLLLLSLIMLFSISSAGGADYFTRQAVAVVLGVGIYFLLLHGIILTLSGTVLGFISSRC